MQNDAQRPRLVLPSWVLAGPRLIFEGQVGGRLGEAAERRDGFRVERKKTCLALARTPSGWTYTAC
jgi:hypothetical protein